MSNLATLGTRCTWNISDVRIVISDLEYPRLRSLDQFLFYLMQYSRSRRLTVQPWAQGSPGIFADVIIAISDLGNPPNKKLR